MRECMLKSFLFPHCLPACAACFAHFETVCSHSKNSLTSSHRHHHHYSLRYAFVVFVSFFSLLLFCTCVIQWRIHSVDCAASLLSLRLMAIVAPFISTPVVSGRQREEKKFKLFSLSLFLSHASAVLRVNNQVHIFAT